MAAPIKRNADGTVDLSSLNAHVSHLKGKYAQNAANYEANTGHKMDFSAPQQHDDAHKHDGPKQTNDGKAEEKNKQ
ncbi:unnamed protein product [Tilletia controversa]|uniref:Uncharacterized protein n=3 Tax=Tilletia TaxID=13289 RepID=A0A8X7MYF7_9BASI|nr:hypothetical protein CF328_g7304 [Tilletia controversa]KAE8198542.1 hypothetical protein CF336_g1621 [Tilletia laevis]KAE8247256.1 hypothetical protein A4X03_0g7096 [Tilletia caries]KAE8207842.1 hypothetical protein CF335_g844 [Tilletia laevis]KAE8253442.1 hypothetical protein A4X06_0g1443 [Tilletia controversa]